MFIVELPGGAPTAPIDGTAVRRWIERVPDLMLDGERPSPQELGRWLANFWLPDEPILFVGRSAKGIGVARRVDAGHLARRLAAVQRRPLARRRSRSRLTCASGGPRPTLTRNTRTRCSTRSRGGRADLPFANLARAGARSQDSGTGRQPPRAADPAQRNVATKAARPTAGRAPAATRAPRPKTLRGAAARPAAEPTYVSAEGLAKLTAELEELRVNVRPRVIARVKAARELGDLKENADYEYARKEQSFVEGRILSLEAMIKTSVLIDEAGGGGTRTPGLDGRRRCRRRQGHLPARRPGRGGSSGRADFQPVAGRSGVDRNASRRRGHGAAAGAVGHRIGCSRSAEHRPYRGSPSPSDRPWWQSGVIYQVYPRSFQDSNGDGVGDLNGIRARLDYLQWLGVDAIWLSPIFRSPMADFGYDVADYRAVDPLFGTLADLDALIEDAHRRGLRGRPRLRPQPHVRRASVVRRRAIVARLSRSATGTSGPIRSPDGVAAQQLALAVRRLGVGARRGHRPVLPPLVPARAARPQLAQPRGARRDVRHAALLARPRHRRLPHRRPVAADQGRPAARQPGRSDLAATAARRRSARCSRCTPPTGRR